MSQTHDYLVVTARRYADFYKLVNQPCSFLYGKTKEHPYGKAAMLEVSATGIIDQLTMLRDGHCVRFSQHVVEEMAHTFRQGNRIFAVLSYDTLIGYISVQGKRSIFHLDTSLLHTLSHTAHEQINQWRSAAKETVTADRHWHTAA